MTRDTALPDQTRIRREFPALNSGVVFLENAGGSQVPAGVADAMHRYLRETYVQLGAGYPLSEFCTETVAAAHDFARTFVGARDGHAIIGPSTTALLNTLAAGYAEILEPGREIIVAETGHEANLGPWKRLAARGLRLRWWRVDPETFTCPMGRLYDLLSERTALVALPHVSNLLGGIVDLAAVTHAAHGVGARVVADGVAYAPHRAVDVAAWDVDWYAYSTYKVYGPHMAVLYGKPEALAELPGPNHFFVTRDEGPYFFEPGGPSHEGCAGLLALGDYLKLVAGAEAEGPCRRAVVTDACERFARWEIPPLQRLLEYLREKPSVRILGPATADTGRVATVSFVHAEKSSRQIAAAVNRSEVAIRHGHMYAWHLCEALGIEPEDGVVRVSMVHYNTLQEIERLIEVLDPII
jgi:cysteine desulfurase family protein (TIGR01976 family)